MLQFNKIRIPLYNNFLKNRRFFDATNVKFCSESERKSLVDYMPILIVAGTGVGTCIGSYHGYQDSKKYTYTECIFTTICFGWLGGGVGYLSTQFFPAAFVIVIVATIARQMDPAIEPEKKDYTDRKEKWDNIR